MDDKEREIKLLKDIEESLTDLACDMRIAGEVAGEGLTDWEEEVCEIRNRIHDVWCDGCEASA